MQARVFVTGLGIISGIGKDLESHVTSLFHSLSGISGIQYLDTHLKGLIPVSEVKSSNQELLVMSGLPAGGTYSRNTLLGVTAAREAFSHAGLGRRKAFRTGLISATTVGGMDQCERYYQDFLTNDSRNEYIGIYDCADSTENIARSLGITGYRTTISTACSSAANAILLGARLIRQGYLDRVIAGGTESLTVFHINGFNALKILDKEPCRPFDARRNGITLGEGAAYVVLESEDAAKEGAPELFATLAGYGNACEAYHQTASSPDGHGAWLAMDKALRMSGLRAGEIGYVNAHGTGTDNNDLSEGIAIERLFGDSIPPVSSTKPFTGHTTSAAGSTEAILSILAMRYGVLWPNLNFLEQMPELKFSPVQELAKGVELKHVMSNSFGFGGNDTSLIFSKVTE
jgi:3-oxoacyl-(acyl-carrier-protein) synthase